MTAYIHRITRCSWILTVLFIGVYSGAFGQNADTEQEELKPAEPLKATTMMRRETQWVVGMVERAHYTQRAISELDYETFITSYMADLDTNHLYFLQEDVDEFSIRFANSMRGWLRRGDLYPAFEIFNRFRENALERIRWIETRLDSPFNFTSAPIVRKKAGLSRMRMPTRSGNVASPTNYLMKCFPMSWKPKMSSMTKPARRLLSRPV